MPPRILTFGVAIGAATCQQIDDLDGFTIHEIAGILKRGAGGDNVSALVDDLVEAGVGLNVLKKTLNLRIQREEGRMEDLFKQQDVSSNFSQVPSVWHPPLQVNGVLDVDAHWSFVEDLRQAVLSIVEQLQFYRTLLRPLWRDLVYMGGKMRHDLALNPINASCSSIDEQLGGPMQLFVEQNKSLKTRLSSWMETASMISTVVGSEAWDASTISQAMQRLVARARMALKTSCRLAPPGMADLGRSSVRCISAEHILRDIQNDIASWFAVQAHLVIGWFAKWGSPGPLLHVLEVPCCTCQEAIESLLLHGLGPEEVVRNNSFSGEQSARRLAAWHILSGDKRDLPAESILLLEIGVLFGMTPQYLLPRIHNLAYVGLDLHEPFVTDGHLLNTSDNRDMAAQIVGTFKDRARLLAKSSHDAQFAQQVPERSLDVVFIDGDHSRKGLEKDLVLWASKVRCGGLIVGDDLQLKELPQVVWEQFAGKIVYVTGKTFVVPQCNCYSSQMHEGVAGHLGLCSMGAFAAKHHYVRLPRRIVQHDEGQPIGSLARIAPGRNELFSTSKQEENHTQT